MWLLLWIAALLPSETLASSPLPLTAESQGPRSEEEARVLFAEGRKAHDLADWQRAATLLHRLVARYPAFGSVMEARLMLGRARLRLLDARGALTPLGELIEARQQSPDTWRARILRGEAYVQLTRWSELLQLTRELADAEKSGRLEPGQPTMMHLLEAEALLGLQRTADSEKALLEARRKLPASGLEGLRARLERLEMEAKLSRCAELPGKGAASLDEGQLQLALSRRGDCLAEAMVSFKEVLRRPQAEALERREATLAGERAARALADFNKACSNPPLPTGVRSKREKAQYLKELKPLLAKTCGGSIRRNLDLLDSWKSGIPPETEPAFAQVRGATESAGRL